MTYRQVVKLIEGDGWRLVRVKGSHHHYRHPAKSGIVTVAGGGKANRDVPAGTMINILKQAGLR